MPDGGLLRIVAAVVIGFTVGYARRASRTYEERMIFLLQMMKELV